MKKSHDQIILLYKKLLDIEEQERLDIKEGNFDKIESGRSVKEKLIDEVEKAKQNCQSVISPEESSELKTIVERIIMVNEMNSKDVKKLRDTALEEINGTRKRKTAIKAYNKLS